MNGFLAEGGDNFSMLIDGCDRLGGDLDVVGTDFGANSSMAPGPQDSITVLS